MPRTCSSCATLPWRTSVPPTSTVSTADIRRPAPLEDNNIMPRRQKLQLCAGLTLAATALSPPTLLLGGRLYAVRTLAEMVLLFGAAPLVVMGLNLRRSPFTHPVTGMVVFNVLLVGWQLPVVVALTAGSLLLEAFGDCLLLLAAIAFWHPVLSGGMAPIARIGYLLVAGCPPTIPGILLAFARHPLYGAAVGIHPEPVGHGFSGELPDHRSQLGQGVEGETVVDPPDMAVFVEQAVAALAVGVVDDPVEGRHHPKVIGVRRHEREVVLG